MKRRSTQLPKPPLRLFWGRGCGIMFGMAEIKAIFHKCEPPETGYWAEVPSLPGCVSEGATLEECKAMIRDAAEGWLESAWELAMRDRKASVQKDDIVSPVFA